MTTKLAKPWLAVALLSLTACSEPAAENSAIEPHELTDSAIGHFCGMTVTNHKGPKGQVFVKGKAEPYWFVSAQDTLAFMRLPENASQVRAAFVTDMGSAFSWDDPGNDSWRDAAAMWFVVGSSRTGGMGAQEIVPFADKARAETFVSVYGGEIKSIDKIETNTLLGSAGSGVGS